MDSQDIVGLRHWGGMQRTSYASGRPYNHVKYSFFWKLVSFLRLDRPVHRTNYSVACIRISRRPICFV